MKLLVSSSPHFETRTDTAVLMRDVVIALLPALVAAVWIFGLRALVVTCVSVAAAVLSEYLFEKATHKPNTIADWSAVVTGVLLAFNLPVTIPLWQAALGSAIAIVVVKQLFGGIGRNFANPAIVGRIVLFLSFSKTMTTWQFPDAVSTATCSSARSSPGTPRWYMWAWYSSSPGRWAAQLTTPYAKFSPAVSSWAPFLWPPTMPPLPPPIGGGCSSDWDAASSRCSSASGAATPRASPLPSSL